MKERELAELISTAEILTSGGDKRIVCGSDGLNKYGFSSTPDPSILAFGSSTGSTVSGFGFDCADKLRNRLQEVLTKKSLASLYEKEMHRLREELTIVYGLQNTDVVFAASGTDVHLIASLIARQPDTPLLSVVVEGVETGSGVPAALGGEHFSDCSAYARHVLMGRKIDGDLSIDVAFVKSRGCDGTPRSAKNMDGDVEKLVSDAVSKGTRVLLTLVDVSKTGLIVPSPSCAIKLLRQFPDKVDLLVDACQLRMAPSTIRAYLEQDALVAITGSKFITGPTFSGALLIPSAVGQRMRNRALPQGLEKYSSKFDWPKEWIARETLPENVNFGLLLRWEAALAEMKRFYAIPEVEVKDFFRKLAKAVQERLSNDTHFEPLVTPLPLRSPFTSDENWDSVPTIFPFLLRSPKGRLLAAEETKHVHEMLRKDLTSYASRDIPTSIAVTKCQVGQPVLCGEHNGQPVAALRLCTSARHISEAQETGGRAEAVIRDSMRVLDKTAQLARLVS